MNAPSESVQFLDLMSEFFAKILPIVGVIVLIALVFLFWEIIKFIRGLEPTIDKINGTIDTVEQSMGKLQAPLNTVESISYSIDSVHFASKRAVDKSVSMITDNYVVIKDWVSSFFDKKEEEPTYEEPMYEEPTYEEPIVKPETETFEEPVVKPETQPEKETIVKEEFKEEL